MGKNKKKEDLNVGVMIFCIIGVVLTVLGVLLIKNTNLKMNIIGTEGTVTGVQTSTNANGEIENVIVNLHIMLMEVIIRLPLMLIKQI